MPAPADTEQRECARGAWCTGYRLVQQGDGTSKREPGLTYQAFCRADETLIGAHLSAETGLPAAWSRLEADLGDPARRGEMIRVPFGPRMLLSEYYDLLMRRIAEVLCSHEERVRAAARLSPVAVGPVCQCGTGDARWNHTRAPATRRAVERAASTLETHLSALLALGDGPVFRHIPSAELKAAGDPRKAGAPILELWQDAQLLTRRDSMATILATITGAHAGLEIIDLHRRCLTALGEVATHPELLDGIPCRSCGETRLERDQAPDGPPKCATCGCRVELAAIGSRTGEETWKHAQPKPGEPVPADGHEATTDKPSMFSRCPSMSCGDRMDLRTYRAWVARYEAWVKSDGPLTCQRCTGVRRNGVIVAAHAECIYDGCECAAAGHREAALTLRATPATRAA